MAIKEPKISKAAAVKTRDIGLTIPELIKIISKPRKCYITVCYFGRIED
jgi:hypothetical protein